MEQFSLQETEKKPEDSILSARSFEELYEILNQIGSIKGSQQEYSSEEIQEMLESARRVIQETVSIPEKISLREVPFPITQKITRTFGLRDKVKELLIKERNAKWESLQS